MRFGSGSWRDIILESAGRVRFRRPLLIDFGGIAKGFAVDRAVEILKRKRVMAAIVNAGGDLRVFGSASQLVHLRHPKQPNRAAGVERLRERAIATSGMREPNIGCAHRPSRLRLDQRDCGRSELRDGGCTDESCVRTARTSRASISAVFSGCVAPRTRRQALLDV